MNRQPNADLDAPPNVISCAWRMVFDGSLQLDDCQCNTATPDKPLEPF